MKAKKLSLLIILVLAVSVSAAIVPLTAQESSDDTINPRVTEYIDRLLVNYDQNKDERLDQQELKKFRGFRESWDLNRDGLLDSNELLKAFTTRREPRQFIVVGTKAEDGNRKRSNQLVDVAICLAKIPPDSELGMDQIAKDVEELEFDDLLGSGGIISGDHLTAFQSVISMTAIDGESSTLTVGSQTPVKTGSSTLRDGSTIYDYQSYDVGLHVDFVPNVRDSNVQISFNLAGSYLTPLEQAEGESFSQTEINKVECKTTASCQNGKATAIQLLQNKQRWILVVAARKRK